MGVKEYALFIGLVIVAPLVVAVAVTLWTLEQARLRNKKYRKRAPASEPPVEATAPPAEPPR